jgi:DNA-binding HxlR family transcriptional regulator
MALDRIGERWTLLIVRDLMIGPKRFKDLLEELPGIGTNLLTERLRELEREGIVTRRALPPPAGSTVYELTEAGRDLEPVVLALGRWGRRFIGTRQPTQSAYPGWFLISLRGTFRPELADGLRVTYGVTLDGLDFEVRVADGDVRISQGEPPAADFRIVTDLDTLIGLLHGQLALADALHARRISISPGARADLQRFVTLFRRRELSK